MRRNERAEPRGLNSDCEGGYLCPSFYRKCISHEAVVLCVCVRRPTERERTERLIKTRLREIMMQKDLENVTSKEVRTDQTTMINTILNKFLTFAFPAKKYSKND